jgi:hypothetical protein
MSELVGAVQAFIDDINGKKAWVEELNAHSHKVAQLYKDASRDEIMESLRRLAALFPNVPLVALGVVAITCGSLVEHGGDTAIAGPDLLDRLPRIIETAGDFYHRCRALAVADAALIDELRRAADDDDNKEEATPAEIIDDHIREHGEQGWRSNSAPCCFGNTPLPFWAICPRSFFASA